MTSATSGRAARRARASGAAVVGIGLALASVAWAGSPPLRAAAPSPTSPFTGTWVADLDSQSNLATDRYFLKGGDYRCLSCTPPRHYPADGKLRRVGRDSEGAMESVVASGPRAMVTTIVEPAMRRRTTMTVSRDGRMATYVSIDHRPGIHGALRTVYVAERTAPAPPGAHPVSGSWRGLRYVSVPEVIRTTRIEVRGERFTYSAPIGVGYSAIFGGPAAAVHSRSAPMTASVERAGDRKVVETRKEQGKVIMVRTFALSADGQALTMTSFYPATGSTFVITARRKGARR